MPAHPLKAWPHGEWWMSAESTDTSTSSGVAYCWSFRLMTTWYRAHHVPPERSAGWICKQSDLWLLPLWLRTAFWFEISLAISGWTGRCCLYPQGTWACKVSNQVRQIIITKHAGHGNGPFRWTVDAIRVLNTIWCPSGRRWELGIQHFAYAGHHPPSIYGPSFIFGVPDPNTLVGSRLHQMHLKHPTWFNGTRHAWRKTKGGRSPTATIILKWSPGSKVYRVPSSTIELPQGSFATCGSVPGRSCLSR